MKHIKSYEQFLTESNTAKEIEANVVKMGKPKDDEDQLADDMAATSKGPRTVPEDAEDENKEDENKAKEKKTKALAKKMKDSAEGEEEIEIEVVESTHKNEDHETFDDKVMQMGLGKVLDVMQKKDPEGYKAMEKYIKKNFSAAADESWFTTMTS